MAFNEDLALRIRNIVNLFPNKITSNFKEKKMFGGLAFLYKGKMTVGIVNDSLMVRVIDSKMPSLLKDKNIRPMDFTKRPMKEFIYVDEAGYRTELQLQTWIELGLEHAQLKLKKI